MGALGGEFLVAIEVAAVLAAFAMGALLFVALSDRRRRLLARVVARASALGEGQASAAARNSPQSVDDRVVSYVVRASDRVASAARPPVRFATFSAELLLATHGRKAGFDEEVSVEGLCVARRDLCVAGLFLGVLTGAVLSVELSAVLGIVGAVLGWKAPSRAIRRREADRAEELERHLSEMLETVAMGLRSGLSFDRSLELYCSHFDTLLATSCDRARKRWSSGLATREEALRGLAASYDSPAFVRVVDTIVRSLRFGSSMARSLEDAAVQARSAYRARKQEQVAKAPVKMMIPTGTLMLPAMLLLVLGPVLLELMEGF